MTFDTSPSCAICSNEGKSMVEKALIALATAWGPQHGGINSFNYDFIKAFGVAFHHSVRVLCVVPRCGEADVDEAWQASVKLIGLPHPPSGERLEAVHAAEIVRCVAESLATDTVWLGHDLFSGAAVIEAARQTGTKAAVINHMCYTAYEAYKTGSSPRAAQKRDEQK